MTYVPASYDATADVVRRPWLIKAATPQLAMRDANEQLKQFDLPWRLVQLTVASTGESVFRERWEGSTCN